MPHSYQYVRDNNFDIAITLDFTEEPIELPFIRGYLFMGEVVPTGVPIYGGPARPIVGIDPAGLAFHVTKPIYELNEEVWFITKRTNAKIIKLTRDHDFVEITWDDHVTTAHINEICKLESYMGFALGEHVWYKTNKLWATVVEFDRTNERIIISNPNVTEVRGGVKASELSKTEE